MTKNSKYLLTSVVISVLIYNILPLIGSIIKSDLGMAIAILSLMFINTAQNLITNMIHSYKCGFKWYVPIIITALFVPTMYMFFNSSAIIYMTPYIIFGYIGAFIGVLIKKK